MLSHRGGEPSRVSCVEQEPGDNNNNNKNNNAEHCSGDRESFTKFQNY